MVGKKVNGNYVLVKLDLAIDIQLYHSSLVVFNVPPLALKIGTSETELSGTLVKENLAILLLQVSNFIKPHNRKTHMKHQGN